MKNIHLALISLMVIHNVNAQHNTFGEPWVNTYSIVAYDSITGDMGVAVQSHWFSVGSIVLWGEAGVGVVATQSLVNPAFGPQGLALLKTGLGAAAVVEALVKSDEGRDYIIRYLEDQATADGVLTDDERQLLSMYSTIILQGGASAGIHV